MTHSSSSGNIKTRVSLSIVFKLFVSKEKSRTTAQRYYTSAYARQKCERERDEEK